MSAGLLINQFYKIYRCDVCNKSFSSFDYLKGHIRIHCYDDALLNCCMCGKQFTHYGNLVRHIKGHRSWGSYACDLCERQFNRADNLADHMSVHTGDRKYVCGECGRTFLRSSYLEAHIATHAGNTDYVSRAYKYDKRKRTFRQCSICGKMFFAHHLTMNI